MPHLWSPTASGLVMGCTLPRSNPRTEAWGFYFPPLLPRTEFEQFPGICPVVTGHPGTGDNPIRNAGLTAGSGEVKVSLSGGQSKPWTETTYFHNQG